MINETIKNKYIVCKSLEHGKKIIDFFVENGASNTVNHIGDSIGSKYFINDDGRISCVFTPSNYTKTQLPEEFTPNRWDTALLFDCSEYVIAPDGMSFRSTGNAVWSVSQDGKAVQLIKQTITKAEAEKLLGKTIEG